MRKIKRYGLSFIWLTAAFLMLFGCKKARAYEDDYSDLEEVALITDWMVPYDLAFLEQESKVALVGKVLKRLETDVVSSEIGMYNGGKTVYEVEVQKILYGELEEETKVIRLIQPWWVSEGKKRQIANASHMRPFKEGDTWVFFLGYFPELDGYGCMFDDAGCWPLAYPELVELLGNEFSSITPEIASYWRSYYNDFPISIYYEIIEKYGSRITP